MATAFSHAQVIGFDIDPPQQTLADPVNCHFLQWDVLADFPYSDHRFDYVHQRLLVAVIPARRWPSVVKELVRVTRPGGYVELLDAGHHFENAGPATQRFLTWWHRVSIICFLSNLSPLFLPTLPLPSPVPAPLLPRGCPPLSDRVELLGVLRHHVDMMHIDNVLFC
jgi:SAM-dependent methyltransferase